ncbi:hypothetical protein GMLC_03060 [Geomonas limicola]|uniref:Zinc finger/thioredoxin putative domain-containing protein n=1 Tax=Geomonas limicola TaxID=2740186 RepID=A0A6V8N4D4_9BACT|nr:zinc-ribbon domain-containing protein [Geomonas limicola]GFO66727.1 hypothetical protein GMLC_03060 [Geomonas limicola]
MKIECPSCHLTGTINEVELPPYGRRMSCPRCKHEFHVEKPAAPAANARLMNSCPACQYSTFTEEMFAVCPKCGMSAEQHQSLARKQQEREQDRRNQEALQRSYRNPDLVVPTPHDAQQAAETPRAAKPVEITSWSCLAAGAILFFYAVSGIVKYYSRDWQAILSEPVLEPFSKFYVFAHLGLVPWLVLLFSLYLCCAAYLFGRLKDGSLRRLTEAAWFGAAVAAVHQSVAFYDWVTISSSSPGFSYYAIGIFNALLFMALLTAPCAVLLWVLRSDLITREFR